MEPDQPRRRTTSRVRWATAAVAGGALVATGALTVGVAQAHPAAAGSTAGGSVDGTAPSPAATGGGTSGSAGTDQRTQQQLSPPATVRPGHGGGSHASSGGS